MTVPRAASWAETVARVQENPQICPMSFALKSGEPVGNSVRRLALRSIDRALSQILDLAGDPHKAVHDVRRRCNEVRALLRLVRGSIPRDVYLTESERFRSLRHLLGGARDSSAALEAFDRLATLAPPDIDRTMLLSVRKNLIALRDQAEEDAPPTADLAAIGETLTRAQDTFSALEFRKEGFEAIAEGLTATYRRGRKALKVALTSEDPEALHEWRKQEKHLRQHLRILRPVWPAIVKAMAREASVLAAFLGDDHDLFVLAALIDREGKAVADRPTRKLLRKMIANRRKELQVEAFALGHRLYAEKPAAFRRRMADWVEIWLTTKDAVDALHGIAPVESPTRK